VACRTAAAAGATGVLCLAFPLQPPARRAREGAAPARRGSDGAQPAPRPTRLPELDAAGVPVLVVQGTRDPFGMPPAGPGRTVVAVAGDHRLASDLDGVRAAVRSWLAPVVAGAPAARLP